MSKYKEVYKPEYEVIYGLKIDSNLLHKYGGGCDPVKCRVARCCKLKVPITQEEEITLRPLISGLCITYAAKLELIKSIGTDSGYIKKWGGNCIFSYYSEEKKCTLCSIHTYCLQNNLEIIEYLPAACSTYPIYLTGNRLYIRNETTEEFPCVVVLNEGKTRLIDAFKTNIIKSVGEEKYEQIHTVDNNYFNQFCRP